MAFVNGNRGRGSNGHGVALFSGAGSVTTPANQPPATPTLSAGTLTSSGATLTGSAFSDPDVGDTHAASQWQVTTAADTGFASPVISTGDDATNKTSYAASGLSASTDYLARVRYKDSAGNYSAWATSASFTTAAGGAKMDAGFNFRATLGFATDSTNEVFASTELYPHTYTIGAQSVTAGWDAATGLTALDRTNTFDRRITGCVFSTAGTPRTFKVDLPAAGSYTIHLAMGDPNNVQTMTYVVKDGATPVSPAIAKTAAAPAGGTNVFFDAAGTSMSAISGTLWASAEAGVTVMMAGTQLLVVMGDGTDRAFIAHLRVVQN